MTTLLHKTCNSAISFDCSDTFKITSDLNFKGGKIIIGICEIYIKTKHVKPKFVCMTCKEDVTLDNVEGVCTSCLRRLDLDNLFVGITAGNKVSSTPLCDVCMNKYNKDNDWVNVEKFSSFFNKIHFQGEPR